MDVNGDKSSDLVVVGEWMPIKVFLNQKGTLADKSTSFVHFPSSGWWNRLAAKDLDGDGDTDLVAGNCGLNNQFHPTSTEPMNMYYKDFDNNGSVDPIMCYFISGVSYPAASRDDLTDQLPALKKKFLAYKDYAGATIEGLFTKDQLKDASVLKAEMMETVYLENTGNEGFVPHVLPIEAQYSPVYGITTIDANNDGKMDLLLAGNNTWTRIKFGRYAANHGQLLVNMGRGQFKYIPQFESGLNLQGNVRSLAKVQTRDNVQIICGFNNAPAAVIKLKSAARTLVRK
jgi:hypothetical protein